MLEEFTKIRQVENIHRKLFSDNFFDLYLWYESTTTQFIGFQLIFCVNGTRMALTAENNKTPDIHIVESGDDLFYDPTDILDGKGYFPKNDLYKLFLERSITISPKIRKKILKVIEAYKIEIENPKIQLTPLYE